MDKALSLDGKNPIESNGNKWCARCKMKITPENDSGWEVFVEGGKTQPICVFCNVETEISKCKEE
jgi:hypothetical protein